MRLKKESGDLISPSILVQMLRYMNYLKIDTTEILKTAGFEPETMNRCDAGIPAAQYLYIEQQAEILAGDPYFGLHVGEFSEPGSLSVPGLIMMSSKTAGDALVKFTNYSRMLKSIVKSNILYNEDTVEVYFTIPEQKYNSSRHCIEAAASGFITIMGSITGKRLLPLEVNIEYNKPDNIDEYRRVFGPNVIFDSGCSRIVFSKDFLDTPVILSNPWLLNFFERYIESSPVKAAGGGRFKRELTDHIMSEFNDGTPSIKNISKKMSMSVRSLQNHLLEEGTTFSELLKEIRVALSRKYLNEGYSTDDIAYMLGFSEPSVFRKSFKKWTGITPGEYRKGAVIARNN